MDLELGAYTLVTWRPSELSPWVCKSIDIVVATRLAEKGEVDAVARLGGDDIDPAQWYEPLGNLSIEEAALLPPPTESNSQIRRFHVAPRLTQHVLHCTKYQDSPVAPDKVFVFSENGHPIGQISATLCELVDGIEKSPWHIVQGHLQRRDFSRWIGHLFGDFKLESRHCETTTSGDFSKKLADLIRDRYESESMIRSDS